ncbi:MAG TPA: hypothetical protein VN682_24850 [Terriglobales bacterium]|nr:hypothetical protein [Terriglobales bacterium]
MQLELNAIGGLSPLLYKFLSPNTSTFWSNCQRQLGVISDELGKVNVFFILPEHNPAARGK